MSDTEIEVDIVGGPVVASSSGIKIPLPTRAEVPRLVTTGKEPDTSENVPDVKVTETWRCEPKFLGTVEEDDNGGKRMVSVNAGWVIYSITKNGVTNYYLTTTNDDDEYNSLRYLPGLMKIVVNVTDDDGNTKIRRILYKRFYTNASLGIARKATYIFGDRSPDVCEEFLKNVIQLLDRALAGKVTLEAPVIKSQDRNQGQGRNQGQNRGRGQGRNQGQNPGQGSNRGRNQGQNQGQNQGSNRGRGQGRNQGQGNWYGGVPPIPTVSNGKLPFVRVTLNESPGGFYMYEIAEMFACGTDTSAWSMTICEKHTGINYDLKSFNGNWVVSGLERNHSVSFVH